MESKRSISAEPGPANYAGGISTLSSDNMLENCRTLSAHRVRAAAWENPGAFNIPQSEEWVAFTIAVRPAPRKLTISSTEGGSVTTPGEGVFTYDGGAVVNLVATADVGYRFVAWTGDVHTIEDVRDAETTITVDGDYVITANFVAMYDLVISVSSTPGGRVVQPGEGVFTYDAGDVVHLVAIPDAGYRFVGWTGDVGTIGDVYNATTTITMNGNYSITANFVAIYDLTVSSTEGGTVTTPGVGVFTYDEGTVVNLVAQANNGYRFVRWTGHVSTVANVSAATTNVTMNGNYTITANFVRQHNLTTNSTEGGSVTTPGEGVFTYDEATVVNLVAQADVGYRFVNWTGNVSTVANVSAATTNVTMNGNYTITANFVRQHNLTTSSTEGGSVTTPGEGVFTYDVGTIVSLVATPASGYRFVKWTGDVGAIADVYDASTNITVNSDYAITANFIRRHNLTISSTEGGSVTIPGAGAFTYDVGTIVSLVATPASGYRFVNWTGNVSTVANATSAATTIRINGDYSICANFVMQHTLTVNSTVGGSVTVPGEGTFAYDADTVVNLVATPARGYRFVNWTGNVATVNNTNAASTTITMLGNYSITANFEATPQGVLPPLQYCLIVSPGTGGSIVSPGVGIFAYDAGTVVNLVATPATGYRFVRWSGDVDAIADVYAAETTITMNKDCSVAAVFVATRKLSIASTKGGSVIAPSAEVSTHDEGAVVNLVAEAEEGYRFVEWVGDVGTIADVYAAETTITMNSDYSITANFERLPPAVYPTVTTRPAAKITSNSATLNMNYTIGNFSPVQVRFAYKKFTDSTWSYTAWVPKTADGAHAEAVTGLEFNTTYDFKSQLKYNGTVVGGSTLQFTTAIPSPAGSRACFIATAAYGTPTAKQINLLREFRDAVLLKSAVGSQLVALYYKVSPPISDFITANELLRSLVRELMVHPIVWVLQSTGGAQPS